MGPSSHPSESPGFCLACGTQVTGRFCHRCGTPLAGTRRLAPWAVWLGVTLVAALGAVLLINRREPAPPPAMTGAAPLTGRAPDISALTNRQAFDRLYERVMAAAAAGDTATVVRFTAHAFDAYAQLDSVDADARFHAGILAAQVGEYEWARALADTILIRDPGHLLGFLLRGTVAELLADEPGLALARRDFLNAWTPEGSQSRSEYLDHQTSIDQFRQAAQAAAGR